MIIGLSGPIGAGKTTAGRILSEHYGLPVRPFAEPIKRMLEALGVPARHLYGTPAEKSEPLALLGGRSARDAMQTLGTEWGRQLVDPDIWVRAWAERIPESGAIADDVRMLNEIDVIRGLGGIVIEIVRSKLDLSRFPKHATENFAELSPDFRIYNSGTEADLRDVLLWTVDHATARQNFAAGVSSPGDNRAAT